MATYICLLAAYIGALTFSAAAVAPMAVRLLDEASCAILLRSFWVYFHRFAAGFGLVLTIGWAIGSAFSALPLLYGTALIAIASIMTLSFWTGLQIIPSINAARDRGDESRFNRLHRLDVTLVGIGLLMGVALLIGLVYVLPGQFTFWPSAN